jgi:hypothetical protein
MPKFERLIEEMANSALLAAPQSTGIQFARSLEKCQTAHALYVVKDFIENLLLKKQIYIVPPVVFTKQLIHYIQKNN